MTVIAYVPYYMHACMHYMPQCIQFDLSFSLAVILSITLIDTYTHFELHIDIDEEFVDDLYPKIIPQIRQSIFKGFIHKASVNLHYYNSTPKPALVCQCGEGEAHTAASNIELGFWLCPKRKRGRLISHQLTWLDSASINSDTNDSQILI